MANGRLTYVGHATVLTEVGGARFLTDPLLHGGIAHMRRRVPLPQLEQLRDLDAVLISHAHADHLDVGSLRRLRHTGPVLAPQGCAKILWRAGAGTVVEMTPGASYRVRDVEVDAVEAKHDGRRHPLGRQMPALGFLIDGPTRIYFAGDTDLFDAMSQFAGRVDVALLPIWGWGPRLPDGHLNPESAARAVALIQPSVAVPIHWGTMRSLGTRAKDDPQAAPRAFAAAVAELGLTTDVRILAPGETMPLRV
jgi:L-ascorbate metabolism protein UlaG (beta-lactamase superfamily)